MAKKKNLVVPAADNLHACNILYVPDEITPKTIAPVVRQALAIHMVDSTEPVSVVINSPGGDTDAGFNLIEILLGMKRPVVTYALGGAWSCGFLIYLAGDIRIATPRTTFLLHQYSWYSAGKYHELVADRAIQDHMNKILREYITERASDKAAALMTEDKSDQWLTARQAQRVGIVHRVVNRVCIPRKLPVEKEDGKDKEKSA